MTDAEFEATMVCVDPKPDHCQCEYCRGGVRHASDCAVHNIPAVAIGGCTCGAETGTPQASRARENELPGMTVGFFVPGQPVAKGRPIAGRGFGGRVTLRTPGKTVAYEGLVAHECHAAMKGMAPMRGPLKVDIDMRVMIPASWSKKKQEEARAGIVRPTKKPDLDNVVKGICDGMNGIAYDDDSQIVLLTVRKTYSDAPCVGVLVQILEGRAA